MTDVSPSSGPAAIIGAGPAGRAVSETLSAAGVGHDVYDENPLDGGNITRRRFDASLADWTRGALVNYFASTIVSAVQPGPGLVIDTGRELASRRYEAVFLCTGALDLAWPTKGRAASWSSAGALQALLKGQGVIPDGRIVLAGAGPFLHVVAADLAAAGAQVLAVVDGLAPADYLGLAASAGGQVASIMDFALTRLSLMRHGVKVRHGARIMAIAADSLSLEGGERIAFDRLGLTDAFSPAGGLARTAGCRQVYEPEGYYFRTATDQDGRTSVPGVFACGEAGGVRGAAHAAASGRLAGAAWLAQRAGRDGDLARLRTRRARLARFGVALESAMSRRARPIADDAWACACERVPTARVRQAIAFGLTDPSDIKIVTRAGMGNCQGRYCEPVLCRLLTEAGVNPRAPFNQRALVKPVLARELADG